MPPRAGTGDADGRRVIFVDLLRAIAVFQMVQGHSIDAVLSTAHRAGAVYDAWSYGRGLTAVAFLVAAGFAFEITTLERFERHRGDRAAVSRRFRRAALLVLLGYALHFPSGALFAADMESVVQGLRGFVVVDVLQCIGITLLFLELTVMLATGPTRVTLICGALAVGVLGATPLCAAIDPEGPWRVLTNYFARQGGSVFPLFPWSAHFLSGVFISRFVRTTGTPGGTALRLAGIGLALVALSWTIGRFADWGVVPDHLARLGWVVAVCAVLAHASRFMAKVPRWLSLVSSETLVIYVFHILLVYGYGVGLASTVGPSLHPFASALVAIVVMVGSYTAVLCYRGIRRRSVANAAPTR